MEHVSSTQLVDAVRGVLASDEQVAMDRHLEQDCVACREAFQVWRRIASFAERERAYEPPADTVRVAKAYMATMKVAIPESATLVFDSFRDAVAVGVRVGAFTSRHLLYQARHVAVDLRFEFTGPPERILLSGQIADTRRPTQGVRNARVTLLWGEQEMATVESNEFGEFECEVDPKAEMALSIAVKDQPPILIRLDLLPASSHPIWNPASTIGE